ncbi:hypothetical protein JOD57_002830 [Geodermatophilus bullaregiensis]|uniref:hypothetical protein n=1 Tax=Geodermatophilus bullaregiensis TaxID=1564160 RepID=UPI00195B5C14|nr:hypothetical protein [Geodermatophilus bullaregiensis]MBM7806993.1 hypothetical protein [Geodermatophilus bullaregiensis]
MLLSTDFGRRSAAADGDPYWVTLVEAGFGSSDDVDAWCASAYPELSAEQLANTCVPRTLTEPHDDREAWTAAGWTYRALGRRAG